MTAQARRVRESFVNQHHLGPVTANILEFHTHECVADAVRGVLPVPREHEADGMPNFAVHTNGDVGFAVGARHAKAVSPADPEIDRRASERPAVAFLPPPVHQLARISPRAEERLGVRLDDARHAKGVGRRDHERVRST